MGMETNATRVEFTAVDNSLPVFQAHRESLDKVSEAYDRSSAAAQRYSQSDSQSGSRAQQMSATERALAQVEQSANRTAVAMGTVGTSGTQSMQQYGSAVVVAEQKTRTLGDTVNVLKGLLVGVLVAFSAHGIADQIDQYTKYTSQLKLATNSTSELATAQDAVRRISKDAQSDLAGTGVLYARISNGTRELGTAQAKVAEITEAVNLGLKVSGATATESASAQLQLSQAFASGTLRGEEFNAVNEAGPRIMKALADGMGQPVGALKEMASNGKITAEVMANSLPKALEELRKEAKEVQTISGSYQVLKNNVLEFVGVQSQASGVVTLVTGGIDLLSNNLGVLAGGMATVMAVKFANYLSEIVTSTYATVAANRALATSNLATAQANVAATASTLALADARVIELHQSVLSASGASALAVTTNGLIPAQARATAASVAHTEALAAQSIAVGAASTGAGVLRGAMAFLGGPVGLLITVLGVAATAWSVFGNKAEEANDKALQSTVETSQETISRLDKEIEKLNERNSLRDALPSVKVTREADQDALARAKKDYDEALAGKGKAAGLNDVGRLEVVKSLGMAYGAVYQRLNDVAEKQEKLANTTTNDKLKKWLGENGTKAQQMAAALDAARKEVGTLTPEMEKLIRAKYQDKKAADETIGSYGAMMKAITEKIAVEQFDIDTSDKSTEGEKYRVKVLAASKLATSGLTEAEKSKVEASLDVYVATEKTNIAMHKSEAFAKAAAEENIKNAESLDAAVVSINKQVQAQQDYNDRIGMTPMQLAELEAAELERQATSKDSLAVTMDLIDWSGKLGDAYRDQANGLRSLAGLKRVGADKSNDNDVTKAKELLDIMSEIDNVTQKAAQGMAASFGRVGSAIGGLTTALSGYGRAQATIAAKLADDNKKAGNDPQKLAAAQIAASQETARAQISSYANMATAAKGFFKENSAGYRAMEGAEKAYRAVEMAMAIQTMLTKSGLLTTFTGLFVASKATETAATVASVAPDVAASMAKGTAAAAVGVATQAQGDPYTAWPRMAMMAAAMAALGFAVAGGGGGGGGQTAAERQKEQGTGSVFGDASAKSDTIAKSIDDMSKNSSRLLPVNQGMLAALKNIESSMAGFTNLVVRDQGVIDGSNLGIKTGMLSGGTAATNLVASIGEKVFGSSILGTLSRTISNLFSNTKQTIVDSGVQFGGKLSDLQAGKGFNQYASVDTTKSSWFGLSKSTSNSVQSAGLSNELSSQLGLIFTSMNAALREANQALGGSATEIEKTLNDLTLSSEKVSLKGLSGTALTEALNSVISKSLDEMAAVAFPQYDKFREVGEGYAQTVLRVANTFASVNESFGEIGLKLFDVGDAGVAASLGFTKLLGGLENLQSVTATYYQNYFTEEERNANTVKLLTAELEKQNLVLPSSRDGYRALVEEVRNTGTPEQLASLLKLNEAFASIVPAVESVNQALELAKSIEKERIDLQTQINALTMSAAEVMNAQRNAINESNRAKWDELQLLQQQRAQEAADAQLASQIAAERAGLQSELNQLTMTEAQLLDLKRNSYAKANRDIFDQIQAAKQAEEAIRQAQETSRQEQEIARQADDAARKIRDAWQGLTDNVYDEVRRIRGLTTTDTEQGYALAKTNFAVTNARASAGDQAAYALLPNLSKAMLAIAEQQEPTLQALRLIQAQTAGSLLNTSAKLGFQLPSFAVGTDYVPQDMIAQIHKGEKIVPAAFNSANQRDNSDQLIQIFSNEISELTEVLADLLTETEGGNRDTARIKDVLLEVTENGRAMKTEPAE